MPDAAAALFSDVPLPLTADERAQQLHLRRFGPTLSRDRADVREIEQASVVVVTSALNNSPLNRHFWASLGRYVQARRARLVVIPARYRNPTSPGEYSARGPGWWWPKEVVPHLFEDEIRFNRHLVLRADLRIQATAVHPLDGLDGFNGGSSIVVGHAQIAMRTVATPQNSLPKLLHTTGSVSMPSYSQSGAGAKGRFHHQAGAVVLERDGSAFHLRALVGDDDGGFYDLDRYFGPDGVKSKQRAAALICGDTHVWWQDPGVRKATYEGSKSIAAVTRPERIVLHDVIDSYSISHHHEADPVKRYAKAQSGHDSLARELEDVAHFLERVVPQGPELVVVASNHHEHIGRWIRRGDWRTDPRNAETYLELALAMVRAAKITARGMETIDPFAWWMQRRLTRPVRFLARGESYRVARCELTLHGDRGPGGARGSIRNLSRLGTRVVIGHGHAPGICHGASQTGTSGPTSPEYALGDPSRSMHTHAVLHQNSKVQLVSIVNGRWRPT